MTEKEYVANKHRIVFLLMVDPPPDTVLAQELDIRLELVSEYEKDLDRQLKSSCFGVDDE